METPELVMPVIGVENEHLAVCEQVGRMRDQQAEGARSVLIGVNKTIYVNNDPPTVYGISPSHSYWGASDDTLALPSGAGLYIDLEQPEVNTPETLYPRDAYRHMCAVEWALANALEDCPQETLVWLMNRSQRPQGNGYVYRAGHLNIQMLRDDWLLLTHECYFTVLRAYLPFTLAVGILLGSGAVGDETDEAAFLACQRVGGAETVFPSHQTTMDRTLGLNLRGNAERLTANKAMTRNHIIGPHDSTVSPTHELRIAAVQAATYALLRAMPRRPYPDLSLQAPLVAAHLLNRDPWLPVTLNDGRRLNAMDLVEAGVEAIDAALAGDEHAAVALPQWGHYASWLRHVADALRRKDLAGSGAEWAMKKLMLDGLAPQAAHELDVLWHQIEPALFVEGGEHLARDCGHAPAFTEAELAATLVTPPDDTRAYLRGHIVQRCIESGEKVQMCDWDGINLPSRRRRVSLPTPEDCTREELGDLEGLSLEEILDGPGREYTRALTYDHRYRAQHHVRPTSSSTTVYPLWADNPTMMS